MKDTTKTGKMKKEDWGSLRRMAMLPVMDKTVDMLIRKYSNSLDKKQKTILENLRQAAKNG